MKGKQDFQQQSLQWRAHTFYAWAFPEYILCAKPHMGAGDKVNQMVAS